VLLVGGIYVFCIWAEVNGLGIDATNALTGSATPWNDLAAQYAPWMTLFIIVASVSSMFAVMVNSNNGIIRIFYAMGREGLLPAWFAHVNPKRKTPTNAVFTQGAFSIAVALIVGALSGGLTDPAGGSSVYGYLGFLLTLGILPVYILTNLAAIRFLRGRPDYNVVYHLVPAGARHPADDRAADRPDPAEHHAAVRVVRLRDHRLGRRGHGGGVLAGPAAARGAGRGRRRDGHRGRRGARRRRAEGPHRTGRGPVAMTYVIGVDVGSQSVKGLLLDGAGEVCASSAAELKITHPRPAEAEQDPDDWTAALATVVGAMVRTGGIDGTEVTALNLACQVDGPW